MSKNSAYHLHKWLSCLKACVLTHNSLWKRNIISFALQAHEYHSVHDAMTIFLLKTTVKNKPWRYRRLEQSVLDYKQLRIK
jgi:hypothetical protein